MMRRPTPKFARRFGVGALALLVAAGCNEDFITGPPRTVTLSVRNWSDTLVLGERRAVRVRVLDGDQNEVLDSHVRWDVASPAVLGSQLNGTGANAARIDGIGSRDSVQLRAAGAGRTGLTLSLTDPRFGAVTQPLAATVVVAGVGVASAHDTTITTLGDTAAVRGTAFARTGVGLGAALAPVAGQGVVWTHRGPGAVTLVGSGAPGDSVRAVATGAGTDTLIATHPFCLSGARCADTTVIHVTPTLRSMGLGATALRAWAFGDSVTTQVVVQDTRGNPVSGVRLALVPVTAADSAIVGVNTAAGVPALSRAATQPALAPSLSTAPSTSAPAPSVHASTSRQVTTRPLVLVVPARGPSASHTPALAAAPAAATPIVAPPLVAQANGTARVAVQARLADGTLLGSDTLSIVVRQVADSVHVTPAYSDLTPGDSIPVHIEARDARGHLIQDATFQPAAAGALYRDGRIVVSPNATAGTGVLQALVTGVASPANNPGAPIPTPAPDTARVVVRVPPPMIAGDTTTSAANSLGFTVRDRDGNPLRNTWVRFRIPAGALQGPDSVQSDANGAVALRWTLPTQPGSYTATAVLLGTPTPADSAGLIVLRRTVVVTTGAAAGLAMVTQPPTASPMASALNPAPVVQVVDRYGNAVAQAGVVVTASLPASAGSAFTWGGTLTETTGADGRARFTGVTGSGAAGSYPLQFDAAPNGTALAAAVSSAVRFTVGAVQGGRTTVTVSAPSIASGTTATVTVTPRDAFGNVIGTGQTVLVTVPSAPATGEATASVSAVTDRGDGTYTATLTGVRAGTPLLVSASVNGVALSGPTLTVTAGTVSTLVVSPATRTLAAFGAGPAFTATATDAAGNAVSTAGISWASSATGIATVAATGTPTAVANGTTTITTTLGGVSATATLTVQQTVATLTKQAGDGQSGTISAALATAPVVAALDANGNRVVGVSVQFAVASGGGTIAGGATHTVTTGAGGTAAAGSWVLGGTTGANTLTASAAGVAPVTFASTAGPALALSVTSVEKLPNGTQQFAAAAGPSGPYTWTAGGVAGGNGTFGTVSPTGLYTAPASVPSPNVVQVCASAGAASTQQSCAAVTVSATPSAGGDVVVLNDMNVVSNAAQSGLEQTNGSYTHPENVQFVTNLISFTGSGARASQHKALFYLGAGSQCAAANFPCNPASNGNSLTGVVNIWSGLGYTSDTTSSLATIPSDVKLVYILRPQQSLSTAEINALKQFAVAGGRIVVQGEWLNSFTQAGINAENALLGSLGSQLQNAATNVMTTSGGSYATSVTAHQVTTGLSQLFFNCSSTVTAGPNDFALVHALTGETILGVTKVDPTPIP